jgi:hypothetical protein
VAEEEAAARQADDGGAVSDVDPFEFLVEQDDEPWAKCFRWLWEPDPDGVRLSSRASSLYGWLLARYGGYQKGIFPSQEKLAADLGWSLRKVQYAIADLKRWHGVMRTEQRGFGKSGQITLYCKAVPPW